MKKIMYKAAIYMELTNEVEDFLLERGVDCLCQDVDKDILKDLTNNLLDSTKASIKIISKLDEL
ncbi:MAG: hypothetical protein GX275_05920 [Clostridiales bacterium]|nr:hypothetical protein [Clostridiales bacterium]